MRCMYIENKETISMTIHDNFKKTNANFSTFDARHLRSSRTNS